MPSLFRLRPIRQHRTDTSKRSPRMRQQATRHRLSFYRAAKLAVIPVIAGAAALTGLILTGRSSALGGPPALSCTGQMSAAKCKAVQQAAGSLPAQNSSAPAARNSSPAAAGLTPDGAGLITCGATFFAAAEARQLAGTFGLISCFRITGQDQWILLGDGMSTAASGVAAPGGAIVAVERCPSGDATCLNPDVTRSFGSFVVTRPPDPQARPLELQTIVGNSVLLLSTARCGLFSFDVSSLQWYGGTASAVHALLTHPGGERPVAVTRTMTGAQALGARPPAGPTAGCHP
jgi:hypothetical protein